MRMHVYSFSDKHSSCTFYKFTARNRTPYIAVASPTTLPHPNWTITYFNTTFSGLIYFILWRHPQLILIAQLPFIRDTIIDLRTVLPTPLHVCIIIGTQKVSFHVDFSNGYVNGTHAMVSLAVLMHWPS